MSQAVHLLAQSTTGTVTVQTAPQSTAQKLTDTQRLNLYNSLFGDEKNKICDKTGLRYTPSLNYSLFTFLHLSDTPWVLAMIDMDDFDMFSEKYGQSWSRKVIQIGNVIRKFCSNNPNKLKGFLIRRSDWKINDNDDDDDDNESKLEMKHDLFAVLIYSAPNITVSERYIVKLFTKIKQQTNETVSAGIAKMNEWETFEEWKLRAFKNMKQATKKGKSEYYSDIGIKYVNPTNDKTDSDEKKETQAVKQLGNQQEFDDKMKQIANNEDYDWILAMIQIDDFDPFVYLNEMNKIEKEMYLLFDMYGNSVNENEYKYYGYKLNNYGNVGAFGMILWDSKDREKCYVPAHVIIDALNDEIKTKCSFTVSIGCSRPEEDDLGMTDDWYDRVVNNLKQAQKNGGNQVCFGSGDVINSMRSMNSTNSMNSIDAVEESKLESKQESKPDELDQDDEIVKQSLATIQVRCFVLSVFITKDKTQQNVFFPGFFVWFFCFLFFVVPSRVGLAWLIFSFVELLVFYV